MFESGPYRIEFSQGAEYVIVGPGSRTPRRFPRLEAESIAMWMNEAYAEGRAADEKVKAVVKAARGTVSLRLSGIKYGFSLDNDSPEGRLALAVAALDASESKP